MSVAQCCQCTACGEKTQARVKRLQLLKGKRILRGCEGREIFVGYGCEERGMFVSNGCEERGTFLSNACKERGMFVGYGCEERVMIVGYGFGYGCTRNFILIKHKTLYYSERLFKHFT
jgi:hypothetical protein